MEEDFVVLQDFIRLILAFSVINVDGKDAESAD